MFVCENILFFGGKNRNSKGKPRTCISKVQVSADVCAFFSKNMIAGNVEGGGKIASFPPSALT